MVHMDEAVERVVLRLNEVCETITERFSADGDLGDMCGQLLAHAQFVQWEVYRELYANMREFDESLTRKRGNGCVNVDVVPQPDSACVGLIKLTNIPRLGDNLAISLDVRHEGVTDDDLLNAVYRLRKQTLDHVTDAAFLLWVTTSQQTSGDSLDRNIRDLSEKHSCTRPKLSYMWDVVRDSVFDLEFQLCPDGSKLALTLWRLS